MLRVSFPNFYDSLVEWQVFPQTALGLERSAAGGARVIFGYLARVSFKVRLEMLPEVRHLTKRLSALLASKRR
jgi:hypothetical protein